MSHDDAEALLTRRSKDHPEVAALVTALSSGWSGPGDRGGQHLTAIHEAAKLHAHGRGPVSNASSLGSASGLSRRRVFLDRSKAFAFKLSSSVIALSAATMGLAHAGVDLPGNAAEKAFSAVGIELPNQGGDNGKSVADDVKSAKEGLEPGCERGQAVAAAASQNSKSESKERPTPCDNGKGGDRRATSGTDQDGNDRSSKGRSKATSAKSKDKGKGKESRGPAEERPEAPEHSKGSERANPRKGKANGPNSEGSSDKSRLGTVEEIVEPSRSNGLGNAKKQ